MRKLLIKLYYRRTSVLWVEKWKRTKFLWYFRNYLVEILVSYAVLINVFVFVCAISYVNWDCWNRKPVTLCHLLPYCFGTFFQEFWTSRNPVWMTAINVQIVCCNICIVGPLQEHEIWPTLYEQTVQHAQYFLHVSAALDLLSTWWIKGNKMTVLITHWYKWQCSLNDFLIMEKQKKSISFPDQMLVHLHKWFLGEYFMGNVLLMSRYNIALTIKYLKGNS